MPKGNIKQPKKSIQPFVPVRPSERTALYSHRELCALASTDPRNELDEMSEPLRFKKNVNKLNASFDPAMRLRLGGSTLLTFIAGASVGAALVALAVPTAGLGFREDLHHVSHRAEERVGELANDSGGAPEPMKNR